MLQKISYGLLLTALVMGLMGRWALLHGHSMSLLLLTAICLSLVDVLVVRGEQCSPVFNCLRSVICLDLKQIKLSLQAGRFLDAGHW